MHARSAMGVPGPLTSLEELMYRVLSDLLEEGVVVKIADDLYCGSDTHSEVLHNKETVLQALDKLVTIQDGHLS